MKLSYADKVIKVNHAGEFGAIGIYSAQIFIQRLFGRALVNELIHYREHERRHRQLFADELERRSVRRCRSYYLCGFGGYCLGLMTGLCGANAIHATTFAVEQVVLSHLSEQLTQLDKVDQKAAAVVRNIVDDETLHHDQAKALLTSDTTWIRMMTKIISAATETVIWLGMRI